MFSQNVPAGFTKRIFKETPHKDCCSDAQSAFSSDCPKRRRNTGVFQGVLGKNEGKMQAYERQSAQRGLCALLP